jgi:hypothetical protein
LASRSELDRARARTEALLEPLSDDELRRERFALEAGLRLDAWWTDRAGDFAVALLTK